MSLIYYFLIFIGYKGFGLGDEGAKGAHGDDGANYDGEDAVNGEVYALYKKEADKGSEGGGAIQEAFEGQNFKHFGGVAPVDQEVGDAQD